MRIRRLAEWGDEELLATALDRSIVVVPAGASVMGSNAGREDEWPEHRVQLEAFAIGRFEVTNVQYARFLEATGREAPRYWEGGVYPRGQGAVPVVGVTWEAAETYCEWSGGSLPSEAQWEAACRGREARIFPWGNRWEDGRANVALSAERAVGSYLDALWPILRSTPASPTAPGLQPVGSFPDGASPLGVLDMQGNAAEWARDWYTWDGYWDMPASNPIGEGPEWNRSIRGSSWFFGMGMEEEAAFWSRCSARNSSHSSDDPRVGFRCVYPAP
jgi:formylglycine-generating enzyme required for sulfatase activity